MKTINKKLFTLKIVMCFAVLVTVAFFMVQSNQQLVAHAQEPQEILDHDNTSALEMIGCIEVELQ